MAITKFSNSSLKTPNRYNDFLAGNSAYDPGGFWPIASATGTGSSNTITFSSIPSTFKHLQLRSIGRTDNSAATRNYYIQFNSDTGTNYAYHRLYGTGSAASAEGASSAGGMYMVGTIPGTSTTANVMGVAITDILDYGSTSKNKTIRTFDAYDNNGAGIVNLSSGLWMSTSAVTSISIVVAVGNWTTNTTFELYGIKEV